MKVFEAQFPEERRVLYGPPSRCREQLAAFREAGIDIPILTPGVVGDQSQADAVRKAIEIFA